MHGIGDVIVDFTKARDLRDAIDRMHRPELTMNPVFPWLFEHLAGGQPAAAMKFVRGADHRRSLRTYCGLPALND